MSVKFLHIALLGVPSFLLDGMPLPAALSAKSRALLCYLAVTPRPATRERLAGLLWSDSAEADARRSLRVALTALNRVLPGVLSAGHNEVAFDLSYPHWLDVQEFMHGLRQGDLSLRQERLELYRGDFLSDFPLRGAPLFEEWATIERERLRQHALSALSGLAEARAGSGQSAEAIALTRRLLELDPWREEAHRQLMRLLAETGQRSAALQQFERCRQLLADNLGVEPAAETLSLAQQIRQPQGSSAARVDVFGDRAARLHPFAPASDVSTPQPRLNPAPPGSAPLPPRRQSPLTQAGHLINPSTFPLIGRAAEIKQVLALLSDPACRLLTLTGPGGVGKTRLALEAARRIAAEPQELFSEDESPPVEGLRVCFIALENVTSTEQLPEAVAGALGIPLSGVDDPSQQVFAGMGSRPGLLIFDNFEHLVTMPPEGYASLWLSQALAAAPHIKMLVTSRQPLELYEEWLFDVPGLGVQPGVDDSAMQLFAARARRAAPRFSLEAERPAVERICRLLEGLPLGIELAAARVRSHSCAQIVMEMETSLNALAVEWQNIPPRHRSLRACIAWGYRLLNAAEQALLRRVSIFRGGWTLTALSSVAGAATIPDQQQAAGLAVLVSRRFVSAPVDGQGERRYHLHEAVRQFAFERLQDAGEADESAARHLQWCLALGEQAAPALQGAEPFAWLKRLDEEHDNLMAALEYAASGGERLQSGLRLAMALCPYWGERGKLREGQAWIERLLAQPGVEALRREKAGGLAAAASLAAWGNAYSLARQRAQAALEIYRQVDDLPGQALSLRLSGQATGLQESSQRREFMLAQSELQASADLCRQLGDRAGLAEARGWQGALLGWSGQFAAGEALLQESIALSRQAGHAGGLALGLSHLASLYIRQGHFAAAQPVLEESLSIQRRLGRPATVYLLSLLGTVALRQYEAGRARQLLEEAAGLASEFGLAQLEVWAICHLGYAWLQLGDLRGAYDRLSLSLRRFVAGDQKSGVVYALEGFARLSAGGGDWEGGVRLIAWAEAMRQQIDDARPPVEQTEVDQILTAAQAHLGAALFAQAQSEGRRLSLDQAVGLALEMGRLV